MPSKSDWTAQADRIRELEAALAKVTAERDESVELLRTCGLIVDDSDGGHWSIKREAFLARIGAKP